MYQDLKEIEAKIKQIVDNCEPELNTVLALKLNIKLGSGEKSTDDITMFNKDSAASVYAFMRSALGPSPVAAK